MITVNRFSRFALLCALLLPTLPLMAASSHEGMDMGEHQAPAASGYILHGEVVKLDAGRVVLSHQAIAALNWPAMTMPFQLASSALATGLKPGLKIEARFVPVEGDAPRIVSWKAMP